MTTDNLYELVSLPEPTYEFANSKRGAIAFNCGDSELLRIEKDGFYVRGVRLEQDENEAKRLFDAMHSWMMWATLQRY